MFTKKEFKDNLLGCFEICLFMKGGIERFSTSSRTALKSFIWTLIFLPVALYFISFQWVGFPAAVFYPFQALRIMATMLLFFGIVFLIARQLNRTAYFYQFVTISNWMTLPLMALILPAIYIYGLEHGIHPDLENYATFISLVSYVITGFYATHALRLPWQLGTTIAIVGMGASEVSLDLAMLVKDNFYV